MLTLAIDPRDRATLVMAVERLIALLDDLDGDPDLEDGHDAEPELREEDMGDWGDYDFIWGGNEKEPQRRWNDGRFMRKEYPRVS